MYLFTYNIHIFIYAYIHIYAIHTSRWYACHYVRMVCQGGDHSKTVIFVGCLALHLWVKRCKVVQSQVFTRIGSVDVNMIQPNRSSL